MSQKKIMICFFVVWIFLINYSNSVQHQVTLSGYSYSFLPNEINAMVGDEVGFILFNDL